MFYSPPKQKQQGFTLLEMLTVMAVIAILAGLVLSTVGFVQRRGAVSRAQSEIQAMSSAMENYKADNGIYPRNSGTDTLNPQSDADASASSYRTASRYLYGELSGDRDGNRTISSADQRPDETSLPKSYFQFKPNMLAPRTGGNVTAIQDPFGYSYGYSTINQVDPNKGYNPTFDLWSTGGGKAAAGDHKKWIKNW
jgi:prepilin-type N-terminal cleavage/methylation domain-containing protein